MSLGASTPQEEGGEEEEDRKPQKLLVHHSQKKLAAMIGITFEIWYNAIAKNKNLAEESLIKTSACFGVAFQINELKSRQYLQTHRMIMWPISSSTMPKSQNTKLLLSPSNAPSVVPTNEFSLPRAITWYGIKNTIVCLYLPHPPASWCLFTTFLNPTYMSLKPTETTSVTSQQTGLPSYYLAREPVHAWNLQNLTKGVKSKN